MKKVSFPMVFTLFVFLSCKKSGSSPSGGYITAAINGANETFNSNIAAITENSNGVYTISISGFQAAENTSNQITITVAGTNPVTTGTYSIGGTASDEVSLAYSQPGQIIYGDDVNAASLATVTITSLTGTNVQGTFSGGLTLYSGTAAERTETITNGKFNVNIK